VHRLDNAFGQGQDRCPLGRPNVVRDWGLVVAPGTFGSGRAVRNRLGLSLSRPEAELLQPLPAGSLHVEQVR
jgi:hypothetical protein